jgi:hypothetical protein
MREDWNNTLPRLLDKNTKLTLHMDSFSEDHFNLFEVINRIETTILNLVLKVDSIFSDPKQIDVLSRSFQQLTKVKSLNVSVYPVYKTETCAVLLNGIKHMTSLVELQLQMDFRRCDPAFKNILYSLTYIQKLDLIGPIDVPASSISQMTSLTSLRLEDWTVGSCRTSLDFWNIRQLELFLTCMRPNDFKLILKLKNTLEMLKISSHAFFSERDAVLEFYKDFLTANTVLKTIYLNDQTLEAFKYIDVNTSKIEIIHLEVLLPGNIHQNRDLLKILSKYFESSTTLRTVNLDLRIDIPHSAATNPNRCVTSIIKTPLLHVLELISRSRSVSNLNIDIVESSHALSTYSLSNILWRGLNMLGRNTSASRSPADMDVNVDNDGTPRKLLVNGIDKEIFMKSLFDFPKIDAKISPFKNARVGRDYRAGALFKAIAN